MRKDSTFSKILAGIKNATSPCQLRYIMSGRDKLFYEQDEIRKTFKRRVVELMTREIDEFLKTSYRNILSDLADNQHDYINNLVKKENRRAAQSVHISNIDEVPPEKDSWLKIESDCIRVEINTSKRKLGESLMESLVREIYRKALSDCGGNRFKTSKLLGVCERTIRNKINKYKLS